MTVPLPRQERPRVHTQDTDFTLYQGDVLETLRELEPGSVDCVVTSPPYWGLRDYGTGAWDGGDPACDHVAPPMQYWKGSSETSGPRNVYRGTCGKCGANRVDQQLGLETTPDEYVARMVDVFREVRRVLADHGTCWVNLGDSYAGGNGYSPDAPSNLAGSKQSTNLGSVLRAVRMPEGLKPKDLVGIPWRVAFALQADGWYLRSDIVWSKPNPMPESVTDRPTKAHEYVFLLSKRPRYWFDQEAVREQFEARPQQRLTATKDQPLAAARIAAGVQQGNPQGGTHVSRFAVQAETLLYECQACGVVTTDPDFCGACGRSGDMAEVEEGNGSIQHREGERWPNSGRNIRSVWDIATQPYAEAHFATFPEELVRRCVLAGCPERVCRTCGKASERIVEREENIHPGDSGRNDVQGLAQRGYREDGKAIGTVMRERHEAGRGATTLGWSDCGHNNYRTGVVLDPFMGSGTTALVARKHHRHALGIELNETYCDLAARRLQQLSLFGDMSEPSPVTAEPKKASVI